MDTPVTSHITSEEFNHVYEPAEDSFLLLDALEKDMDFILEKSPALCVEIGTGSGIIITALAKLLQTKSHCTAIDINPVACRVAKKTALINQTLIDVVNMDLLTAFKENSIDLLVFNPPYVPSRETDETFERELEQEDVSESSSNLIRTWAGGVDGREIIDKVLLNLNKILAPNGVFYLLLLKENKPSEVVAQLQSVKFIASVFMERRIIGEHLFVIKVIKPC